MGSKQPLRKCLGPGPDGKGCPVVIAAGARKSRLFHSNTCRQAYYYRKFRDGGGGRYQARYRLMGKANREKFGLILVHGYGPDGQEKRAKLALAVAQLLGGRGYDAEAVGPAVTFKKTRPRGG